MSCTWLVSHRHSVFITTARPFTAETISPVLQSNGLNGYLQKVAGKVEGKKMKTVKVMGLLLAVTLIAALPASAHGRFGGGLVVVPSFGAWNWYYPHFGPYGFYDPYPVYSGVYSNTAELKLTTNIKDAEVYINGAYAGKAAKLKSMRLRPDTYTLEVRAPGYAPYSERVYLLAGKTMHIDVNLVAARPS